MVLIPEDIIASISNTLTQDFYGVPIWFMIVIVIFIFIVILIMKSRKNDDLKMPEMIDEEKLAIDHLNIIMKNSGKKLKYKSYILQSMIPIARLMQLSPYNHSREITIKHQIEKNASPEQLIANAIRARQEPTKIKTDNYYLAKTIGTNPIQAFIYFFLGNFLSIPFERFMLIPQEYRNEKDNNNISIPLNAVAYPWDTKGKIWIFEEGAAKVIHGIIEHKELKQVMKDDLNKLPQIQYHEQVLSKFAGKLREIGNAKTNTWKKKNQNQKSITDDDIAQADEE